MFSLNDDTTIDYMSSTRTLILPGGAGYLGVHLSRYFVQHGYQVVILSRAPQADSENIRHLCWDGRTLGPWAGT